MTATWNTMTDTEQVTMITKCIYTVLKQAGRAVLKTHELDELVNETWLRLIDTLDTTTENDRRAAQGKEPITLAALVCKAAHAAIAALTYNDRKHSAACETLDDLNAAAYTDTAAAAIMYADLDSVVKAQDTTGQTITRMLVQGHTEKEIAAKVGISGPGVHYRITKIRAALSA